MSKCGKEVRTRPARLACSPNRVFIWYWNSEPVSFGINWRPVSILVKASSGMPMCTTGNMPTYSMVVVVHQGRYKPASWLIIEYCLLWDVLHCYFVWIAVTWRVLTSVVSRFPHSGWWTCFKLDIHPGRNVAMKFRGDRLALQKVSTGLIFDILSIIFTILLLIANKIIKFGWYIWIAC